MINWGQITWKYTTKHWHTQLDKGRISKWKEHTIHITFINFLWPRIEKDDIIMIKVIGTALSKPNLRYIIFSKSTWKPTGYPGFNFLLEKLITFLPLWLNLEQVPIFSELRIKDFHFHNRLWNISSFPDLTHF